MQKSKGVASTAKMCVSCTELKLENGKYVCLASEEKEIVTTESNENVLKKIYQKPVWCPK